MLILLVESLSIFFKGVIMKNFSLTLIIVLFCIFANSCSFNTTKNNSELSINESYSQLGNQLIESSLLESETDSLETVYFDHCLLQEYRKDFSPLENFSTHKKLSSFYGNNKSKFTLDFVTLDLDFTTTVRNFPHPAHYAVNADNDSNISFIIATFEVTDYSIVPPQYYPNTDYDGTYHLTFAATFISYGCNVTTTDFDYKLYKCKVDNLRFSHVIYVYSDENFVGSLFYYSDFDISSNHIIDYFKSNYKILKGTI